MGTEMWQTLCVSESLISWGKVIR